MAPLKAVFFDWDGTVADSREGIFNSVRYAVREAGIPGLPERSDEELSYFIGPPLYDGFEHVYGVTPEQASLLTDTYRVYYRDRGLYECNLYPGVGDLLVGLHTAGIRTAVVSSKPLDFLNILVEHLGLSDAVDLVVGPSMTNHNSDKSVLIQSALESLGLEPEDAAMVGDRKFDMEGAVSAGVLPVGVLYGYGSKDELETAGAKVVAETVAELAELLREW